MGVSFTKGSAAVKMRSSGYCDRIRKPCSWSLSSCFSGSRLDAMWFPVLESRNISRKLALCSEEEASARSEEHTSELQSQSNLVCRLLLEKKHRRPAVLRVGVALTGSAPLLRVWPHAVRRGRRRRPRTAGPRPPERQDRTLRTHRMLTVTP